MAYLFEQGHSSAVQSMKVMDELFREPEKREQYRAVGYFFVRKEDSCAIQAADLLAWQWYKDKKNQVEGRPRRKDCESLLQLHHNAAHLNRDGLISIITHLETMARIKRAGPLMPSAADLFGSCHNEGAYYLALVGSDARRFVEPIFLNARSNAPSSSAPTSSAVSMNRFDCCASSGFGAGLRGILRPTISYPQERLCGLEPLLRPSQNQRTHRDCQIALYTSRRIVKRAASGFVFRQPIRPVQFQRTRCSCHFLHRSHQLSHPNDPQFS